ncbi:amiloride-sensitive amine oxidase [copper-containing]-like isoform X2 [Mya arenaria]|uniref:amiloride-sensitive amine oxidase [copper-containing]-like isoform X2 n=1 Tax=Mya arenaria TaxID=6604 RepID=UPI0022E28FBA|nr:amiloride-sensitive amine oxidase [copper-containing]-like isoform X2 [Mya arenaria]XP_052798743.1 amiloride-sensitive amine oxidase [copper-containing]-like isoform X2 [Mya arenaria]
MTTNWARKKREYGKSVHFRKLLSKKPRPSVVSMYSVHPSPRVSVFEISKFNVGYLRKRASEASSRVGSKRYEVAKFCSIGLAFIMLALISAVVYLVTRSCISDCDFNPGIINDVIFPRDLTNPDVFDDLTSSEYHSVLDFLMSKPELNLTNFDEATVSSNYIYMIESHIPPKQEVMNYFMGKGKRPSREARVTVVFGSRVPPTLEDIIVSPTLSPKTFRNLGCKNCNNNSSYSAKPIDAIDKKQLSDTLETIFSSVGYLIGEMPGFSTKQCSRPRDCIATEYFESNYNDDERRFVWVKLFTNFVNVPRQPLGFNILIYQNSLHPQQTQVSQIVYNGVKYSTIEDFMRLNVLGRQRDIEPTYAGIIKEPLYTNSILLEGPKLIDPVGKRFRINGQIVEYQRWRFHLHMSASKGLKLFNIIYDGSMIIYEASVEQLVSLPDVFQAWQPLGASSYSLVRGVDCPETAVYLTSDMFVNSAKITEYPSHICVFENNAGIPARRRFYTTSGEDPGVYGGRVDYFLVVRTIASLGDFDYIFDYTFRNDGQFNAEVKTSAAYSDLNIINSGIGVVNVNIFQFKVDIDVNGKRNNRISEVRLIKNPVTMDPEMKERDAAFIANINHFDKSSFSMQHGYNSSNMWLVYSTNSSGGRTKSYQIINNSYDKSLGDITQNVHNHDWTKYPLLVSTYKDNPDSSIGPEPLANVVSDVRQTDKDIVTWITIGSMCPAGAGGMPYSSTSTCSTSFAVIPHN